MAKYVRYSKALLRALNDYFGVEYRYQRAFSYKGLLPCVSRFSSGTYLFFDFPGLIQLNKLTLSLFSSSLTFLIVFKFISFTVFGRTCSFKNVNSSLHFVKSFRRPLLMVTWSVARTGPGGFRNSLHVSRIFKFSFSPSPSFSLAT